MRVYFHPDVSLHAGSPDGVECAARLWTFERLIRERALSVTVPEPVGRAVLARVHDPAYIHVVYSGEATIDEETVLGPGSIAAIEAAAGCAWALGAHLAGADARGMAVLRPPGHHAGRGFGGGYCVVNNGMVAAQALFDAGVPDIAIVDLDAHFPNGTADFASVDPRVFLLTLQQSRLFPREGSTGEEPLPGVVSVPLDPGAGDADLLAVTTALFVPMLRARRPACVLVSLGVDAHEDDVTTDLRYSTAGYAAACAAIDAVARELGARVGYVLEGGYDPASVGAVIRAIVDGVAGEIHGTPLPSTLARLARYGST